MALPRDCQVGQQRHGFAKANVNLLAIPLTCPRRRAGKPGRAE
jgi:hypothetical protein